MISNYQMPILVVDDSESMRCLLVSFLHKIGFTDVDSVPDGIAALQKICERQYGLVISDWIMEPVSGYDVLQAIRADETLAMTPFIMVTADPDIQKVTAAKNALVDGYITKPFDADTLKFKIEQALA
jgi:two-component system, chemotaxis family, chemotaxis protein CheY